MKGKLFLAALAALLLTLPCNAVSWTGTEWNGDSSGAVGERNCDIVSIGREPARTDSIPYGDFQSAVRAAQDYDKSLSPYYLLLSQTQWQFSYYDCPADFDAGADVEFYREDFDDSDWDEIFVPSVWQTQGYDHPIYTNTTQKFARNFGNEDIGYPRDLPKAPTVYNPIGLYRHRFQIPADWAGRRVYLDFEGVDSAFYLWVNGVQVGYGEDSFTTDEFDITDYVRMGEENTIAVKVYRWCDGSWLEDQDFFDLSGIFRDVYCYAAPQTRVRDYSIVTDFDGAFVNSTLRVEAAVKNYTADSQSWEIALHLLDSEGKEVPLDQELTVAAGTAAAGEEQVISFAVPVSQPRKWSAEDPYLYTLVLEEHSGSGTVYESAQVGFRKITYKTTSSGWFEGSTDDADLIRINGQPICFRGVDRHETHPEYGYAIPKEVMEEDIRIMLENNINAVRTSHYPNSPYWYYLCDKYGIYVVDEANMECHSNMIYENERITDYLSASIIDREYNMVRRDKNHPSVVMWSLGNECKNPEILRTILVQSYPDPEGIMRVLHAETADRPWHYEQAKLMTETGIDVYSGMYYRPEVLVEYGKSDAALPMIECEYEHAMGNSEGNFDEYWDAYDTYRNLQGGFIWDFVDQSIYLTAEDGTRYFGYGGDYGENVHDDNFCANGLLLPDRTVQPEMAEVRYHYQQIKFQNVDASHGRVLLKNFCLFTDIAEKYELHWSIQRDDAILREGMLDAAQLDIPCVDSLTNQPGAGEVQIPVTLTESDLRPGSEYFLNLSLCLKEGEKGLPAGYRVAREQFTIVPEVNQMAEKAAQPPVTISQEGNILRAETETLRVEFDEALGRITSLQGWDGTQWRDLLVSGEGPQGDFFRASTDNDRAFGAGQNIYIGMWQEKGNYRVQSVETGRQADGTVTVTVRGSYPALNNLALNTVYTVFGGGYVGAEVEIVPNYNDDLAFLPVAGMTMQVPQGYEQLTWLGNGPEETYIDRYRGTMVGKWQTTVTDNFFPYVQSSETGNHVGVRYVELTDETGFGLMAAATETMEFSALHYTAEELNRGVHPYELNAEANVILRLNAIQLGVGGDDGWTRLVTHEQYRPHAPVYRYGFILGAVTSDNDATALARSWQTSAAAK